MKRGKAKVFHDVTGNFDRRYLLLCDDTGSQYSCFRLLDVHSDGNYFITGSLWDKDAVYQHFRKRKNSKVLRIGGILLVALVINFCSRKHLSSPM